MSTDDDEYDLKLCARCRAWIPQVATKCSYCQTSQVDTAPSGGTPRRMRAAPRAPVTMGLIIANVVFYAWSMWVQHGVSPDQVAWFGGPRILAFHLSGWYQHDRRHE